MKLRMNINKKRATNWPPLKTKLNLTIMKRLQYTTIILNVNSVIHIVS